MRETIELFGTWSVVDIIIMPTVPQSISHATFSITVTQVYFFLPVPL